MGAVALTEDGVGRAIVYPVTEEDIAKGRDRLAALSADTPEGYKEVVIAIGKLRGTRTAIEKRRVELKAEALEFGRKVDGAAKKLTALIEAIEEPLQAKKQAVDDEKARIKREEEKAELLALQAKLKAEREAEEERLRVAREAEEVRLKTERDRQAAERKRIDDDRAVLEAKQREVDAKAAEVARQEKEARPAPRPTVAVVAPAPTPTAVVARPILSPDPLASEVDHVHAFGREIAALAARAPALAGEDNAQAIEWAVGRLLHIAAQVAAFKVTK